MSDTDIDLVVRWGETGQHVPAKTKAGLEGIKAAAGDAAPAIGDRMATAFARLEAREPTMVLRRTRMAVEELTASALGAHGMVGRLAGSFALLIPGGAVTMGAVGGLALIGVEIKTIIEFADLLEKKLFQLNTTIARGPAALAFKAQGFGQQVDDLQHPGVWSTIKNTVADMLTSGTGSYKESAAAEGRRAELATAQTGEALAQQDFTNARRDEQQRAARESAKAITDSAFAIHKLKLGLHPTNVQLAALESSIRLTAIALSNANGPTKERLRLLELERSQLEMTNAATKDRQAREDQRRKDEMAFPTRPTAGDIYNRARLGQGGNVTTTDAGTPFENTIRGASAAAAGTYNPGPSGGGVAQQDREWERVGGAIANGITMIASSRGGNQGAAALGALGGITTAASSLQSLKSLAPTLGPLGFALSTVSTLASVFGGGQKPKVIITAFEEEAARQIKELRSDPATTQFVIVGSSDIRSTQQALARLGRMGVITRLPR